MGVASPTGLRRDARARAASYDRRAKIPKVMLNRPEMYMKIDT
jgi:hypothetical protein